MALGGDMEKMKKLGVVLFLVIALGISAVSVTSAAVDTSNIDWGKYFLNDQNFDGGAFANDTAETNVSEEPKEIEKDWLETDQRIFPHSWANVTPSGIFPPGWANITSEGWNKKPAGYFGVNWGISGIAG